MSKILVVDDELAIRTLLYDLLSDEGYSVMVANNGARALQLIQQNAPDLVIMDIMMPEMDGREMLQIMDSTPELRDLPVIVMSAAMHAHHLSTETHAFLAKPFDLHDLLDVVASALDTP